MSSRDNWFCNGIRLNIERTPSGDKITHLNPLTVDLSKHCSPIIRSIYYGGDGGSGKDGDEAVPVISILIIESQDLVLEFFREFRAILSGGGQVTLCGGFPFARSQRIL